MAASTDSSRRTPSNYRPDTELSGRFLSIADRSLRSSRVTTAFSRSSRSRRELLVAVALVPAAASSGSPPGDVGVFRWSTTGGSGRQLEGVRDRRVA